MADFLFTAGLDPSSASQIQRDLAAAFSVKGVNSNSFTEPLGRITGKSSEFAKSMEASNARVLAFGASAGAIYAVHKAFESVISSTIEVQKSMNLLGTLFNVSSSTLKGFTNQLFDVANLTGQTFKAATEAANTFARQGLSASETITRTRDALILARIAGMDFSDAAKVITTAINSFNREALSSTEIINALSAADTNFAVSASDLAEAISRVGTSAENANVTLNQTISLITSAAQITGRSGSVIGNSFKSIFTRLERPKVLEDLQSLGIATQDASGNVLPLIQILKNLASTYDVLTPSQKSFITEAVGGVYQINTLKAVLGDLGNGFSVYDRVLKTVTNSTSSVIDRNNQLNTTISSKLNATLNNLIQTGSKVGNIVIAPTLGGGADLSAGILKSISEGMDTDTVGANLGKGILKGLGGILSGPGVQFLTFSLLKLFQNLSLFAAKSIGDFTGLSNKSKERVAIENSISETLNRQSKIFEQMSTEGKSQTQIAQTALRLALEHNQALIARAQLVKEMAAYSIKEGIQVIPAGGLKRGMAAGFVPNFNSEFAQEEAHAKILGASAPRAHYGRGTIGGKRFIMNSQETEIPNFGSNGDSAVIPNYSRGYIPNFENSFHTPSDENIAKGKEGERRVRGILQRREGLTNLVDESVLDKFSNFDFSANIGGRKTLIDAKNWKKFGPNDFYCETSRKLWNEFNFNDGKKQTLDYTRYPVEIYIPRSTFENTPSLRGMQKSKIIKKKISEVIPKLNAGPDDEIQFTSSIKTFAKGFVPNFALDKIFSMTPEKNYRKRGDLASVGGSLYEQEIVSRLPSLGFSNVHHFAAANKNNPADFYARHLGMPWLLDAKYTTGEMAKPSALAEKERTMSAFFAKVKNNPEYLSQVDPFWAQNVDKTKMGVILSMVPANHSVKNYKKQGMDYHNLTPYTYRMAASGYPEGLRFKKSKMEDGITRLTGIKGNQIVGDIEHSGKGVKEIESFEINEAFRGKGFAKHFYNALGAGKIKGTLLPQFDKNGNAFFPQLGRARMAKSATIEHYGPMEDVAKMSVSQFEKLIASKSGDKGFWKNNSFDLMTSHAGGFLPNFADAAPKGNIFDFDGTLGLAPKGHITTPEGETRQMSHADTYHGWSASMMEPSPLAMKAMKNSKPLTVLTARGPDSIPFIEGWLKKHGIPFEKVIATGHPNYPEGIKTTYQKKAYELEKLGAKGKNFYEDDKQNLHYAWKKVGIKRRAVNFNNGTLGQFKAEGFFPNFADNRSREEKLRAILSPTSGAFSGERTAAEAALNRLTGSSGHFSAATPEELIMQLTRSGKKVDLDAINLFHSKHKNGQFAKFIHDLNNAPGYLSGILGHAAGFIPNFSALSDAQQREMKAGYSASQVRVGTDPSLVSSSNPKGVGVYNSTEGSLANGINLAKRAGINPKTKGMMRAAANGFVPNFADVETSMGLGVTQFLLALPQIQDAIERMTGPTKEVTEAMEKLKSEITGLEGKTGKLREAKDSGETTKSAEDIIQKNLKKDRTRIKERISDDKNTKNTTSGVERAFATERIQRSEAELAQITDSLKKSRERSGQAGEMVIKAENDLANAEKELASKQAAQAASVANQKPGAMAALFGQTESYKKSKLGRFQSGTGLAMSMGGPIAGGLASELAPKMGASLDTAKAFGEFGNTLGTAGQVLQTIPGPAGYVVAGLVVLKGALDFANNSAYGFAEKLKAEADKKLTGIDKIESASNAFAQALNNYSQVLGDSKSSLAMTVKAQEKYSLALSVLNASGVNKKSVEKISTAGSPEEKQKALMEAQEENARQKEKYTIQKNSADIASKINVEKKSKEAGTDNASMVARFAGGLIGGSLGLPFGHVGTAGGVIAGEKLGLKVMNKVIPKAQEETIFSNKYSKDGGGESLLNDLTRGAIENKDAGGKQDTESYIKEMVKAGTITKKEGDIVAENVKWTLQLTEAQKKLGEETDKQVGGLRAQQQALEAYRSYLKTLQDQLRAFAGDSALRSLNRQSSNMHDAAGAKVSGAELNGARNVSLTKGVASNIGSSGIIMNSDEKMLAEMTSTMNISKAKTEQNYSGVEEKFTQGLNERISTSIDKMRGLTLGSGVDTQSNANMSAFNDTAILAQKNAEDARFNKNKKGEVTENTGADLADKVSEGFLKKSKFFESLASGKADESQAKNAGVDWNEFKDKKGEAALLSKNFEKLASQSTSSANADLVSKRSEELQAMTVDELKKNTEVTLQQKEILQNSINQRVLATGGGIQSFEQDFGAGYRRSLRKDFTDMRSNIPEVAGRGALDFAKKAKNDLGDFGTGNPQFEAAKTKAIAGVEASLTKTYGVYSQNNQGGLTKGQIKKRAENIVENEIGGKSTEDLQRTNNALTATGNQYLAEIAAKAGVKDKSNIPTMASMLKEGGAEAIQKMIQAAQAAQAKQQTEKAVGKDGKTGELKEVGDKLDKVVKALDGIQVNITTTINNVDAGTKDKVNYIMKIMQRQREMTTAPNAVGSQ